MTDKHVHRFADRSAIESEASEWLARLDSDDPVSTEEFDRLCEWVRRSPAHREALDRLSVVWDQMDALQALAVPLGRSGIHPLAWLSNAFQAVLKPRYAVVAASVAIVIALVALAVGNDADLQGGLANGKFATRIGEIRDLDLADGSTIHLNTDSVVSVAFDSDQRTVFLEHGEAHFQVAPEFGRRFVVFTDIGAIEAIGTAFQVRVFLGEIEVTVTGRGGRLAGRFRVISPRSPRSGLSHGPTGRRPRLRPLWANWWLGNPLGLMAALRNSERYKRLESPKLPYSYPGARAG